MNRHKLWTTMLVFVLAVSLLLPSVGMAVQFNDVSQNGLYGWAYDYIMEMANKGIIKGYPDGRFDPGASITYLELMSLLAHMRPLPAGQKSAAAAKYSDLLLELNVPTWATESLVTNLTNGIVTETELRNAYNDQLIQLGTNKRMDRLSVAVYLAKNLNLGAEDRQYAALIYEDTEAIAGRFRQYVAALVEIGVLNPQGRDGKFEPTSAVKRSEVAKMVKLAYDYLAKNPVGPAVEETTMEGAIQSTTMMGENYSMEVSTGQTSKAIIITPTTEITIGERKATAGDLGAGQTVTIVYDGRTSRALKVKIHAGDHENASLGTITMAPQTANLIGIAVEGEAAPKTLTIDANAKIMEEGRPLTQDKLAIGDRVHFQEANGTLTYLNRVLRDGSATGTVTGLEFSYNQPSYISLRDANNISQRYSVNSGVQVSQDGKTVSLHELQLGDRVTVRLRFGEVVQIEAVSDQRNVRGTIGSFTQLVGQLPEIRLVTENGDTLGPYGISRTAIVQINGHNQPVTALNVGMTGEFVVDGKVINAIYIGGGSQPSNDQPRQTQPTPTQPAPQGPSILH